VGPLVAVGNCDVSVDPVERGATCGVCAATFGLAGLRLVVARCPSANGIAQTASNRSR
jgi:hypothetical protein